MKFQKVSLAGGEAAHVWGALGVDPHSYERFAVRDRRHEHLPVVFESDEAAVKQVLNARR